MPGTHSCARRTTVEPGTQPAFSGIDSFLKLSEGTSKQLVTAGPSTTLIERILSGGMVGAVEDAFDLGDLGEDGGFDTFLEGHG